jgi:Flp pilus assembly protein TadG
MVTAETAVVLPVLLVVLAAVVTLVTLVGAQVRCVDAAREAARAAARGESDAVVRRLAAAAAPAGARTEVAPGSTVTVTVAADVAPFGHLPIRLQVGARAVAAREPAADPAAGDAPGGVVGPGSP